MIRTAAVERSAHFGPTGQKLRCTRRVVRSLSAVLAIVLLVSCSTSSRRVDTSQDAASTPERRQLEVPDGDPAAFTSASVSDRSALIVAGVAGDPYAGIAAAGILDTDGSFRPVEPLPVLQGATAVSVSKGYAITGYRCAQSAEEVEDRCDAAEYYVTFLDLEGRVTEVVPAGAPRLPGETGSSAGEGVILAGEGARLVTPEGVTQLPVDSVSDICAARDGRVLGLRRTPSDSERPEDSPLAIQALALSKGKWQPVGAPRHQERAGITGCVVGGIVDSGSVFDGGRWIPFAGLIDRSPKDVVGLTADQKLLLSGSDVTILSTPAGSEDLPRTEEAALRGWLSVDGRTALLLASDGSFSLINLPDS